MVVELLSGGQKPSFGVSIDQVSVGFRGVDIHARNSATCGTDENQNIVCIENDPGKYNNRLPVARLWVEDTPAATGFLFGSNGYLLTAQHVHQQVYLDPKIEMMYEADECSSTVTVYHPCQ